MGFIIAFITVGIVASVVAPVVAFAIDEVNRKRLWDEAGIK